MQRRVVITGMGFVTPLGALPSEVWGHLTNGRSGVGPLTLFDASRFPVRIAAEVKDWTLADIGENPRQWEHCPRQTAFAYGAGIQAGQQAGLTDSVIDPLRCGVYLGCGEPFEDFDRFTSSIIHSNSNGDYAPQQFTGTALSVFDPRAEREFEPNMPAVHLAGRFNAQGPNLNCIAACVSSAQAIGEAACMIRENEADIMLCGGSHSTIHPFGVTGFQRLSSLSTQNDDPQRAVKPFDRNRDGFVIGEGGAVFVFEELEHARRRGAEIIGELAGYGSSQDAFRVTDTHPEGRGTVDAMRRALNDAQLNPDDIDYINAHGTGTILNDKVETGAIKSAFGQHAYNVTISSTKSMMGHATTACGAIELAVCVLALQHGAVPPTINLETPDPECDLDYVPNQARDRKCQHVLSNSIGFGGQNAALIVSRFDEASPARVTRRAA